MATEEETAKMLSFYQNYGERLQEEIEHRRNLLMEMSMSAEAVNSMSSKEMLMPLGSGIYVRAVLSDKEKVLGSVGAGYFIEKDKDSTVNDIKAAMEDEVQDIEKINQQLNAVVEKLRAMK